MSEQQPEQEPRDEGKSLEEADPKGEGIALGQTGTANTFEPEEEPDA